MGRWKRSDFSSCSKIERAIQQLEPIPKLPYSLLLFGIVVGFPKLVNHIIWNTRNRPHTWVNICKLIHITLDTTHTHPTRSICVYRCRMHSWTICSRTNCRAKRSFVTATIPKYLSNGTLKQYAYSKKMGFHNKTSNDSHNSITKISPSKNSISKMNFTIKLPMTFTIALPKLFPSKNSISKMNSQQHSQKEIHNGILPKRLSPKFITAAIPNNF